MAKPKLWTKKHWPRVGASKPLKERANKKAFEEVRNELDEERAKLKDEKKWEELLVCCDKMLSIKPRSWISWWYKASASYWLSRYTEAVAYYDKASSYNTESQDIIKSHRNECYFWFAKNLEAKEAIEYLDKILEITESDDLQSVYQEPRSFCGIFGYRSRSDNVWFEKGIRLYKMKGESNDTSTKIREEAAECFRKAGKFDMGGIKLNKTELERKKDLHRKSYELTVKGFETEMVADQHHNEFLIRLRYAASQGKVMNKPTVAYYDKAIEYYREAEKLYPSNVSAFDRISFVHRKQESYQPV